MTRIIPDHATAARIGRKFVEHNLDATSFRVFQYEQPRSKLTLFGALILFADQTEQEIRFQ